MDANIPPAVLAASVHPSPREGERILDEARWRFLEELAIGHYFDRDVLITYALRLKILERWERIGDASPELLRNKVCRAGGSE
jgi:Protein of unknown function (DUF2764).